MSVGNGTFFHSASCFNCSLAFEWSCSSFFPYLYFVAGRFFLRQFTNFDFHQAAQGGIMEVEVGKLAQEKGSSSEVKELGKKLEQDHSKANDQLKQLAETKNVPLPTDMGAEKAAVDKLRALSGDQFDKAFLKMAVKDHKKDINEFQKETTNAMDSDVKEFASKTLPTLQEHLKEAEQLQGGMRGRKAASDVTSKTGSTTDAATKAPSNAPATPSK